MSKILMLKGLPASGKTTYAKELANRGGWKRINKDDLRAMLDNGKWSKGNEKFVLKMRNTIVRAALENANYNVVVDDTNFAPIHEERLKAIADEFKVPFEVKLFDVSPTECIRRDLARPNSVGKKVIMDMYYKYIYTPDPYKPHPDLPKAIIVDIDGTLAHMQGRSPFDPTKYHEDTIDETVKEIVNRYYADGVTIIVCSGREEIHEETTQKWLLDNGVNHHELFMRPEDDFREDSIVKREIFEDLIRAQYNVLFVLDDRDRVVAMWRSLGLKVMQVAEGDF